MIRSKVRSAVERSPRVARIYRAFRDQLDQGSPAVVTPWGWTLRGHPTMAGGGYEPDETRLVRELLRDVDVFVNVGANVGYYCCHALELGKTVIAIEPVARNVRYLLANINDNGWGNRAQVFPVALGAESGVQIIWGGDTGASLVKNWASIPTSYQSQVPVLTLDQVLGSALMGRKALILADIEGAEYFMLQGAMKTLHSDSKHIWIVEITATQHQPEATPINPWLLDTFQLFFNAGYTASRVDGERSMVDEELVASAAVTGQLGSNNFIFMPKLI